MGSLTCPIIKRSLIPPRSGKTRPLGRCLLALFLGLFFFTTLATQASVGEVGMDRATLLTVMGEPNSSMGRGQREILSYEGYRVILENGIVTAIDEVERTPPPPPAPRPSAPRESASTPTERPSATPAQRNRVAEWHHSFEQAKAVAGRENLPIFAFFTGSDWCPPCMEFMPTD